MSPSLLQRLLGARPAAATAIGCNSSVGTKSRKILSADRAPRPLETGDRSVLYCSSSNGSRGVSLLSDGQRDRDMAFLGKERRRRSPEATGHRLSPSLS